MALPTINNSGFVGQIKIVDDGYNTSTSALSLYVSQNYERFVNSIIGGEATEIIVNNALTQKWTDLFAGVYYLNRGVNKTLKVEGLTYSVLRYIYFQYGRDNYVPTAIGNVRPDSEVSNRIDSQTYAQITSSKYNEGMTAINCQLQDWLANYSNFPGDIDSFVDNGGGSYTINSSNTIYLENGDTVTIDSIDYTVSNLVDDTSFDISGDTGLSFEGNYFYSPFESVCFTEQEYIVA